VEADLMRHLGLWRNVILSVATCLGLGAGHARGADTVQYRHVEVDGISIFYREAGDPGKPTMLLLHGFPSSSFMFRDLIPLLANQFHLVAPDYPGMGYSEAPPASKFTATFDSVAAVIGHFVAQQHLTHYILYMQPGTSFRIDHPELADVLGRLGPGSVEGCAGECGPGHA
jgi:hypothetical protein